MTRPDEIPATWGVSDGSGPRRGKLIRELGSLPLFLNSWTSSGCRARVELAEEIVERGGVPVDERAGERRCRDQVRLEQREGRVASVDEPLVELASGVEFDVDRW